MRFTIGTPAYSVVGSCDDKDPTTGPAQSYGPANVPLGSRFDGLSLAASNCFSATKLSTNAAAQTGNQSIANAVANAKAEAKSSLVVSYNLFDRLFALFGLRPRLAMQVVVTLNAGVDDGPCGAGFTVFIINGPRGANPVPSWQGLFGISRNAADPTKLDITRPNGLVETIANPGQLRDWPDGPTIRVRPGRYDLRFEVNTVASADGRVSAHLEGELVLYPP